MKVHIKFSDMERDEALRAYAEEKMNMFSKYIDRALFDASVCGIEFKKSTHHQKGDVCYAEVTLETNGTLYRASTEASSLREAVDTVKDEIMRQISRNKEKKENIFRKGSRLAKRLLRGV